VGNRQFGEKLRKQRGFREIGFLRNGKSLQEGYGEVQEMIDICDFAVGLLRQLHGLTMHSEPQHRMYEQYHLWELGLFQRLTPVVWAWNTALAWIAGDVCVWKPSEKSTLWNACQNIIAEVIKENNLPEGIFCLINGDYKVGEMTNDKRVPLICNRFYPYGENRTNCKGLGRSLLELGGNNAIIVTPDADIR
jgi:aldehyde dehydrogenase (NAD+)